MITIANYAKGMLYGDSGRSLPILCRCNELNLLKLLSGPRRRTWLVTIIPINLGEDWVIFHLMVPFVEQGTSSCDGTGKSVRREGDEHS